MNKMMLALGIVLIVIALIFGSIQLTNHVFDIYGSATTKYSYYAVVGIMGLIGIIVAIWGYIRKQASTSTSGQN